MLERKGPVRDAQTRPERFDVLRALLKELTDHNGRYDQGAFHYRGYRHSHY